MCISIYSVSYTHLLDKKCLITELIKKPNFLDGKILYDSLYEIDKSMYEEIEQYLQNINDFKEYIESVSYTHLSSLNR